jgi:uncharacterized membrane protein YtjA (UPF0391 family)
VIVDEEFAVAKARLRVSLAPHLHTVKRRCSMLSWVWMFLVLAVIAAIFGFTGVVAAAAGIAKILFFVFLVVFVVGLFMGRRTAV